MRIGIPKEIKDHEYRVAATPGGVAALVRAGHTVRIEHDAGARIGFADADYAAAGATVCAEAEAVWEADLIFKVKEPQATELPWLRPGQILFCYLHLAAVPELARELLQRGVTAIAFETVLDAAGHTPLLAPMSQVAGRLAVQFGMQALEMKHGGRGVLLAGVPGVAPGRVSILGAGQVGGNAARIAHGIGAEVTVFDRNAERLTHIDELYGGRVQARLATPEAIADCLPRTDLLIGAVYVPGRQAPRLLTRADIAAMPAGSAFIDVAIDQGGISETSRPSSHSQPFYVDQGVVHGCVPNLPGAVARTSTLALAEATLPHLLCLAELGVAGAFAQNPDFAHGLNLAAGQVTHAGLAQDLGLPCADGRPLFSEYHHSA